MISYLHIPTLYTLIYTLNPPRIFGIRFKARQPVPILLPTLLLPMPEPLLKNLSRPSYVRAGCPHKCAGPFQLRRPSPQHFFHRGVARQPPTSELPQRQTLQQDVFWRFLLKVTTSTEALSLRLKIL